MKPWKHLGLALVLGACGSSDGGRAEAAPEPRASSGAELRVAGSYPQTSAGGTPNRRAPETVARRPALTGDLAVQLRGPGRVGPIHEGNLDAVGLTIEVENESDEAISIEPATALVEVFQDGHLVEGCAQRVELKLPHTLAPGVVHRADLPAPCALPEEGDYEIVSTLVVGDEDPEVVSPAEARRADAIDLRVDDALPVAGSRAMPIAPVHAPPTTGSEVPSSADRLREETGPSGTARPAVP